MSMNDKVADDSSCYPWDDMKQAHDDMRSDKYSNDIGDADLEGEGDELMKPGKGDVDG